MPELDDHEARLRKVEGVAAENSWRIEALERAMEKAVRLLEHLERRARSDENTDRMRRQRRADLRGWQLALLAGAFTFAGSALSAALNHLL